VKLFGFFPSLCSTGGEMEVRKNNLTLLKEKIVIDRQGVYIDTLESLEEGQYDIAECESFFEEQVFETLKDLGYTVHMQVGCSG
jgi:hypothetical protein